MNDRVSFRRARPMSAMPGLMLQAGRHASLLGLSLSRGTICKLRSATACVRSVGCAVAGDAKTVMPYSRAGAWLDPDDPAKLGVGFRAMTDASPSDRAAVGARGRSYYLAHFGEQIRSAALERLLVEAIRVSRAAR